MNGRNNDQELGRPKVQVAQQPSKWDKVGNGLNRERGLLWGGDVKEHFDSARNRQHKDQENSACRLRPTYNASAIGGPECWAGAGGGRRKGAWINYKRDEKRVTLDP